MSRVVRTLFIFIFLIAMGRPAISARQAQDPGTPPAPQKMDKEVKRKMKRTMKELDSAYRQWLTEDVTYIISPDERNAFLQLDTNEEREQFIEQFWLRRSSNRSEEHTSELQSQSNLVCRLLLEKKKKQITRSKKIRDIKCNSLR